MVFLPVVVDTSLSTGKTTPTTSQVSVDLIIGDELTDKGREVAKKLVLKIDSMLERASDGLSEEDRIIMYRSLALISSNLQKIYENYENTDDEDEGSEEEE